MKPKLILCLALVLTSGLFGCSTTDRHRPDTNSLKVVVKPEKTQVHVGEHFNLALRVENTATTNQYVRVMSCSWWQQWQPSNPSIFFDTEDCTWNAPMSLKIPAGGAITFDLKVSVSELVSRKFSFQMGFTPIGSKETFWSDDVKLKILPHDIINHQGPLDFLADIPSLKDVSLKMSEAELLEITRQQKLDYTHGIEHGDSMYYVHPKEHVVVIITFRQGHCGGIQRLPD
jgi:hypothetical protein